MNKIVVLVYRLFSVQNGYEIVYDFREKVHTYLLVWISVLKS